MYLDPNGIAVVEETDPIVPLQTLLNSMQSATSNVVSERIGTRISRQRFTGASAVPTTASGVTRNYAYAIKDTDDEGWSTVTFAAQFTLSWPSGNQNYNIASLSSAINPPFVVPAVGNAGNGGQLLSIRSGTQPGIYIRWSVENREDYPLKVAASWIIPG